MLLSNVSLSTRNVVTTTEEQDEAKETMVCLLYYCSVLRDTPIIILVRI